MQTRILFLIALLGAAGIGLFGAAAGSGSAVSPAEQTFERLKREPDRLEAFLRGLPKGGELHLHLAGAVSPDAMIDWALQYDYYVRADRMGVGRLGVPGDVDHKLLSPARYAQLRDERARARFVPLRDFLASSAAGGASPRATLRERLTIQRGEQWDEFPEIFLRFADLAAASALQPALVRSVMARARTERVSYLELRVNPFAVTAPDGSAVPPGDVIAAFAEAVDAQNREWPPDEQVTVRYVVALGRHASDTPKRLPDAFRLAAADDETSDLVVGVDLVGPEELGPPARFASILRALHLERPRVNITLHAGEMDRANLNVRDSILLGARRIGHATNLYRDPTIAAEVFDTITLARDLDVLIEVCLTSNELLVLRPRTPHPFLKYVRDGLPLSLNTDDGGIFDTDLTREFAKAVELADLTWAQVKRLCRNSLQYAFARNDEKQRLLRRWEAQMQQFDERPAAAGAEPR